MSFGGDYEIQPNMQSWISRIRHDLFVIDASYQDTPVESQFSFVESQGHEFMQVQILTRILY